jgi:DNA-binding beta-propeller fold protein YncE
MKKIYIFISALFILGFLISCGSEFDTGQLPINIDKNIIFGDTTYIQINPIWAGFSSPEALIVGNEPLIYVANTGNNEIICLDISGKENGRSAKIKNPIALAQDFKLNLIVCAEFDTLINNSTVTYGAIYKIRLYDAKNDISKAKIERVYFDKSNPDRRFTGAAVMSNNFYYLTRTGPNNTSLIDPDNAVIVFTSDDQFISPISTLKPNGTGLESISELSGIAIVNPKYLDFVFIQTGDISLFKLQWISYIQAGDASYFGSKFTPSKDGNLDILKINRFSKPEGIAVDNSGNIFVVDAAKDSLIRFSSKGIEKYSFGGHGSGSGQFNQPHGVAVFDKTLYIADTKNNRIVRYKLSIDMQ